MEQVEAAESAHLVFTYPARAGADVWLRFVEAERVQSGGSSFIAITEKAVAG